MGAIYTILNRITLSFRHDRSGMSWFHVIGSFQISLVVLQSVYLTITMICLQGDEYDRCFYLCGYYLMKCTIFFASCKYWPRKIDSGQLQVSGFAGAVEATR